MKAICLLTLAFLCALLAACATHVVSPSEEEAVKAVTQRTCDGFRLGDLAMLEETLAPTFTLVGPAGDVQPRTQAFAEVRAGDPKYDVFRNHDMVAHVYGEAATVQGITSIKGSAGGKAFAVDVRFTDTLVRIDGRWQIVVSHATRISSGSP